MLKILCTVMVTVFLLLSPVVSSAMEVTMPYGKMINGKTVVRDIVIVLPSEITEDFTTWPTLVGAYQGELAIRSDTVGLGTICQFVFTNKASNTTYTLYVYCSTPLVLGLQKNEDMFWKYVDKNPVKVTSKALSVFLISTTYAKEM